MTAQEIIEKIRAEVKRQKGYYYINNPYNKKAILVCNNVLSFLGNLEKSEKPIEGLEEEIEYYLDHAELKTKCNGISVAQDYFDDLTKTARHFYELGKQSKPKFCEGLEEEMIAWHKKHFKGKRKWEETSGEYLEHTSQLDLARHFAKWQREQMMKEAVKGKVCGIYGNWVESEFLETPIGEEGDKVRIIIVKED